MRPATFALAAAAILSGPGLALAQFAPPVVAPVVSSEMGRGISDGLSSAANPSLKDQAQKPAKADDKKDEGKKPEAPDGSAKTQQK